MFGTLESLLLEVYLSISYLLGLTVYIRSYLQINRVYTTDFLRVVLVKNFEIKTVLDRSEKTKIGVTSSMTALESDRDRRKSKYQRDMAKIAKELDRNFVDCVWFQASNKAIFIATLLAQIFGSMAFNGLFDIPALLMILALFALYGFRYTFHFGYGIYVLFVVQYIQLAALLNLLV